MAHYLTRSEKLALRLTHLSSGTTRTQAHSLLGTLTREGRNAPAPSAADRMRWQSQMRILIRDTNLPTPDERALEVDLWRTSFESVPPPVFYAITCLQRRATQAALMSHINISTPTLAAPGSQRDAYTKGTDGRPERVWYASYGSNLSRTRFMKYINGGRPVGAQGQHAGCRDAAAPASDICIRHPGALHFAGESARWGRQGVGFFDDSRPGQILGRAYNISSGQFDDIVAQENGGRDQVVELPLMSVVDRGSINMGSGIYSRVIHLGDYRHAPVLTFTCAFSAQEALDRSFAQTQASHSRNEPSQNYLRMLGSGLKSAFALTSIQQVDYLHGCPGLENYSRTQVLQILDRTGST